MKSSSHIAKKKESHLIQNPSLQRTKTTPKVSNPTPTKLKVSNPTPTTPKASNPTPSPPVFIDDDYYEDDGFVVDDVDNCEQLQSLIRQLVRPQGYDPELSISFYLFYLFFFNI